MVNQEVDVQPSAPLDGTWSAALRNSFSCPVWGFSLHLPDPSPWGAPTARPCGLTTCPGGGRDPSAWLAPLHTRAPTSWDEVGPMHH